MISRRVRWVAAVVVSVTRVVLVTVLVVVRSMRRRLRRDVVVRLER